MGACERVRGNRGSAWSRSDPSACPMPVAVTIIVAVREVTAVWNRTFVRSPRGTSADAVSPLSFATGALSHVKARLMPVRR